MKMVFLIILWLFIIFLIVANISINFDHPFVVNGTIILGWLLFAIQSTYRYSNRFYLFCNKILNKFSRKNHVWTMRVDYYGEFDEDIFGKLPNIFNSHKNSKVIDVSNTRKLYRDGSIEFEVTLRQNNKALSFSINDLEVNYKRSRYLIEKELAYYFEKIITTLNGSFEKGKYSLLIRFEGENPYCSMYFNEQNINKIRYFKINLTDDESAVTIYKDYLELNSDNLHRLNNLAKKYLLFSKEFMKTTKN